MSVETAHYNRGGDGTAESREIRPEFEFDFKGGSNLTIGALSSFESVRSEFRVANLIVQPGEYWFHEANVMLRLPRSATFRGEFEGSAGTFYGGSRLGFSLGPTWTVSKYLEVEAGYELNLIRLPAPVSHQSENTTTSWPS